MLQRAVAAADALSEHIERASALAELSTIVPPGERAAILARALQAARTKFEHGMASDRIGGAAALASVARRLNPRERRHVLGEALATIGSADEHSSTMTGALSNLVPDLPQSLFREALGVARTIDAGSDWPDALVTVVPHLTPPQRAGQVAELLELVRTSQSLVGAWALHDLALLVPMRERPPLVAAALAASRGWADSKSKAHLGVRLLPLMPVGSRATTVPEVLALVPTIERHGDRARVLVPLARHLPQRLLSEAVARTAELKLGNLRAWVLTALAPFLDGPALRDALATAREIRWAPGRGQALAALLPRLSGHERTSVRDEALAAVRDAHDPLNRMFGLARVAIYLLPSERLDTWAELRTFGRPDCLAEILRKAGHQAEGGAQLELFAEALRAAVEMDARRDRAHALLGLVPRLPERLRPQGLELAHAIEDHNCRTWLVASLIPWLPEEQRADALFSYLVAIPFSRDERSSPWTAAHAVGRLSEDARTRLWDATFDRIAGTADSDPSAAEHVPPWIAWLAAKATSTQVVAHNLAQDCKP
jgi:hypothetical protein